MKKILVIMTGGTIVSTDNGNGLEPNKDNFIKKFTDCWDCSVDFTCPFNVDSSQIQPLHWSVIAKTIDNSRGNYDGVLVTHGTDTLAYTSTALSLMLKNINIPVVLTGSQIPINQANSDAPENLHLASTVLLNGKLTGVFVAFGGKIIRGDCCSKTKSEEFDGFESINCQDVKLTDVTKQKGVYCFNDRIKSNNVFLLKAFPGIDCKILSILKEHGFNRFVIEAYGQGSLPEDFVLEVKEIVEHGGKVGIVTQCRYNGSNCYTYKSSRQLMTAGAHDYKLHTTEYAVVDMIIS